MSSYTKILMFGPELFGMPVVLIIVLIIWIISSAQEEKEKARKSAEELWKGISPSMSKKQVVDKLGRPQEIVPGVPETWFYEFKDLRGYVMFENDVVLGLQIPR